MARPTKPVDVQEGAMSKEELRRRKENESSLAGDADLVDKPTMKLSKSQKAIRKNIVQLVKKIASNADRYVIDQCAIAIDRLQQIELMTNEEPTLLTEKTLQTTRKTYFAQFIRLCTELSLSPQARAKLANNLPTKRDENPLRELFKDDDDD